MGDIAYAGPKHAIRWGSHSKGCGRYTLGFYSLTHWEFSDGCYGSHARTPWTAIIRQRRYRRFEERKRDEQHA